MSGHHSPLATEDDGRPALVVDGVVQSVAPDAAQGGYWAAMLPDVRPRSALLLGLGGATVAQLLTRRFGPVPITGVDDDPRAVELISTLGDQLPNLQVAIQDAFSYVFTCNRRFDLVCVDLFRGGQMPREVLGKPFLRQVNHLLEPSGRVVFNLFAGRRNPSQVHRLGRVFRVVGETTVEDNLVVHCRRRIA